MGENDGELDLHFDLLSELIDVKERLEELKKYEDAQQKLDKYPLLMERFRELKKRYVDLHMTLEKTTEYYKNQLSEQAAFIRNNKGIVTIDCSKDTIFQSLIDKIMEPNREYIYLKYVDNSVTKVEWVSKQRKN